MRINSDDNSRTILQVYAPPQVNQNTTNARAIQDAINALNESELLGFDRELRFSKDPQSRLGVVEVLNRSTGKVILQIPSEFVLNFAQNLQNGN